MNALAMSTYEPIWLHVLLVGSLGVACSLVVIFALVRCLSQGRFDQRACYKLSLSLAISVWLLHQFYLYLSLEAFQTSHYVFSAFAFVFISVCFAGVARLLYKDAKSLGKWLLAGCVVSGANAATLYILMAGAYAGSYVYIDFTLMLVAVVAASALAWLVISLFMGVVENKRKISLLNKFLVSLLLSLFAIMVQQITKYTFVFIPDGASLGHEVVFNELDVVALYVSLLTIVVLVASLIFFSAVRLKKTGVDKDMLSDLLMLSGIAVALVFILFSHWFNSHVHGKEVSLLYIEQQVDRRLSRAHLWLEELRNGSHSVDWDRDVIDNLLNARKYVRAAISGEVVDEVFSYRARDENLIIVLQTIDSDIDKWYNVVIKHKERSGDWRSDFYIQLEDHLFSTIDQSLTRLDAIAERLTKENWQSVKAVNQATLLFLVLLLVAIYRVYKRNKSKMNLVAHDLQIALKEIEFQKAALDEHSIVSITDRKGKITYSNKKFSEISLYSAEELLGKDHRILNSDYHSREFFRDLWLTISRGKVWRGKVRNRRKDGSYYWVDTTIVPFLDENNTPYKYISIRNDITLIKEAEERQRNLTQELEHRVTQRTAELAEINRAVEADREALQLMVEGTSTATGADFFALLVKYLAAVLKVEYVLVAEQLYTMPLQSKTIAVRAHGEIAENFEYLLDGTPCEEVIINRSAIYARDLGETYQHIPFFSEAGLESYMGVPMSDSRGRILGHLAVFSSREFDDKHRLKSIMRIFATRAASELERQQVEDQLKKARDRAVAASRSKSEFLANMSHELRTPMHAILSFAAMGRDDSLESDREELQHYFTRIRQSGERLMSLLNDLLDLSKLNAGKMTFDFAVQDLAELAGSVCAEFEAMAAAKKLGLSVEPAGFDVVLSIDKERMTQVLRNLVSNAIKFSPDEKKIVIRFAETKITGMTGRHAAIRMDVIDQGVGVPEGEHGSIFEQFQQSSRTNHNAGGTGLGLAICREIVSAHNGAINVVDNPEGGAIFQVTLPRNLD